MMKNHVFLIYMSKNPFYQTKTRILENKVFQIVFFKIFQICKLDYRYEN